MKNALLNSLAAASLATLFTATASAQNQKLEGDFAAKGATNVEPPIIIDDQGNKFALVNVAGMSDGSLGPPIYVDNQNRKFALVNVSGMSEAGPRVIICDQGDKFPLENVAGMTDEGVDLPPYTENQYRKFELQNAAGMSDGSLGPPVYVDNQNRKFELQNAAGMSEEGPRIIIDDQGNKFALVEVAGMSETRGPVIEPVLRPDSQASPQGPEERPKLVIDDFSNMTRAGQKMDQVARDMRAAVAGLSEVLRYRSLDATDLEALYAAVRPAGLERVVQELESVPVMELRDLNETHRKVIDGLLLRALSLWKAAGSKGRVDRSYVARIENLLNDKAATAPIPQRAEAEATRGHLTRLANHAFATGAEEVMEELEREVIEDELRGAMSYVYAAQERGFLPEGWRERLTELFSYRSGIGRSGR